jgi:hypothetical protein
VKQPARQFGTLRNQLGTGELTAALAMPDQTVVGRGNNCSFSGAKERDRLLKALEDVILSAAAYDATGAIADL